MPAKRPPPPPLSYVLRTPTCRMEYKGSHAEGLEHLFVALPDALARRKMIDRLEKVHAKCLERESAIQGAEIGAVFLDEAPQMASQALPSLTPEGHAARLAAQIPCVTGCSNPDCSEYGAAWPGHLLCMACGGEHPT